MISTLEALLGPDATWQRAQDDRYLSLKLGDEYEVCIEPRLFDGLYDLAVYKNGSLVTPKVVIKFGKL